MSSVDQLVFMWDQMWGGEKVPILGLKSAE